MRFHKFPVLIPILILLLLSSCAKTGQTDLTVETAKKKALTSPTPHVQKLIDEHQLEQVDFHHVKTAIGNGTRKGAQAILIDARPPKKFISGTIPSSINIPDTKLEDYVYQLADINKDKELIVFCGGWNCEKSPIVAGYLKKSGFTDVKLYQAGMPEWKKKSYLEVGLPVAESAMKTGNALLMDARPRKKYLTETIPGAMYMYDQELDTLAGRFPVDKNTPIIAFCGGYQCSKSHVIANRLIKEGYTRVSVFAAGMPAWKKSDLITTAGVKKPTQPETGKDKPQFINGIKVGADEGTVDGEWLYALIQKNQIPENIVFVDVRGPEDFSSGHMQQAINIKAADMDAQTLSAQLPKNKVVIFACGSGARAMEAYFKLKEENQDVSNIMYFDANIECAMDNQCSIEVNEPLG